MSYFLIRLLQSFAEFGLASDVQPAASRPPAEWANCAGTKGTDKIRLTIASLTMFVKVSSMRSIMMTDVIEFLGI